MNQTSKLSLSVVTLVLLMPASLRTSSEVSSASCDSLTVASPLPMV